MSILIPILIIIALIIANGLFVAAEFAIVASRKYKIDSLAEAGSGAARGIQRVLKDAVSKDRYIAIAQLGITLASIGLGMYGERTFAGWLVDPLHNTFHLGDAAAHAIAAVIAIAMLTYLHVVFGEMIPKAFALQSPEATALRVATPMKLFGQLFAPAVWLLNSIGTSLLKLLGIPVAGHGRHYTVLELEQLVEESFEGGEVGEREHELIDNIFNFGERKAAELMTPRTKVQGIPKNSTKAEVIEMMRSSGHSRFPVYEGSLDRIIGILHIKDFIKQNQETFDLLTLMRRAPRVPEHLPAESLLEAFKRLQIHIAIVMNEYGGTAGIVTLEDLIEEVVGDVQDEYDHELPKVSIQDDDSYLIDGDVLINDLKTDYGLALSTESSDTIAGYVIEGLGRAPVQGDVVSQDGFQIEVLDMDGLVIKQVRLRHEDTSN